MFQYIFLDWDMTFIICLYYFLFLSEYVRSRNFYWLFVFPQFQCLTLSSPSGPPGPRLWWGMWWSFIVRPREALPRSCTSFITRMSPWRAAYPTLDKECPSTSHWLQIILEPTPVRPTMAWVPSAVRQWHFPSQVSFLFSGHRCGQKISS